jgi:hypothetical protein
MHVSVFGPSGQGVSLNPKVHDSSVDLEHVVCSLQDGVRKRTGLATMREEKRKEKKKRKQKKKKKKNMQRKKSKQREDHQNYSSWITVRSTGTSVNRRERRKKKNKNKKKREKHIKASKRTRNLHGKTRYAQQQEYNPHTFKKFSVSDFRKKKNKENARGMANRGNEIDPASVYGDSYNNQDNRKPPGFSFLFSFLFCFSGGKQLGINKQAAKGPKPYGAEGRKVETKDSSDYLVGFLSFFFFFKKKKSKKHPSLTAMQG